MRVILIGLGAGAGLLSSGMLYLTFLGGLKNKNVSESENLQAHITHTFGEIAAEEEGDKTGTAGFPARLFVPEPAIRFQILRLERRVSSEGLVSVRRITCGIPWAVSLGGGSGNGSNSNTRQFHDAERPFGEIISKEKCTWNLTGLDESSAFSMISDRTLGSCRFALCDALQGHNPRSWNLFRNTP